MTSSLNKQPYINWHALIVITVLHAYFYGFMEWLFFVTKPSSLSILTLFEKIQVLFITNGLISIAALALLALLALPALFFNNQRLTLLACLIPALVLSINALILFDNFTYTVFKFGVISSANFWRIPYTIGFLIFWIWTTLGIRKRVLKRSKPASSFAVGLLAVSLVMLLAGVFLNNPETSTSSKGSGSNTNRPNILIIGSDGLSASSMSLYGYTKDTTPFLKQMAQDSLMAENAFVNVSSTTASTTSMLTGREAMTVKVYRYPDILSGDDAFKHLPGILKTHGYKTVEIGTPYYVDAQELNLLDGFDIVNNQSLDQPVLAGLQKILGSSPAAFFTWTVFSRASDRLLHIFFIQEMRNPIEEVENPDDRLTDQERVNQIIDLLDNADQPLFIFTHMMDTHGPTFHSDRQVFSNGPTDQEWDKTHYEDAILSFDGTVQKIYDHLVETGQINNTILVIYTDHGFQYSVSSRVPILIHFPHSEFSGTRKNNIQVIDVPVTLLEYLHIDQPDWMTGMSFLNHETPQDRKIISVTSGSPKKIKPPFYQIKIVQVIVCQKWYALNVQENTFATGTARGHTAQCATDQLPPNDKIHEEIINYLEQYEYDVSSLR